MTRKLLLNIEHATLLKMAEVFAIIFQWPGETPWCGLQATVRWVERQCDNATMRQLTVAECRWVLPAAVSAVGLLAYFRLRLGVEVRCESLLEPRTLPVAWAWHLRRLWSNSTITVAVHGGRQLERSDSWWCCSKAVRVFFQQRCTAKNSEGLLIQIPEMRLYYNFCSLGSTNAVDKLNLGLDHDKGFR